MASRQRAAVATADFAATAATRDYSSIGRREGVGAISRGHRDTSKRMGTARGCQVGSKRASPPPVSPHERVGRPRPLTQDQRAELLGALANAVFLLALCMSIALDAGTRFIEPEEVERPKLVLIVGAVGLALNVLGLALFADHGHSHGGHDHSHSHGHSHGHSDADLA